MSFTNRIKFALNINDKVKKVCQTLTLSTASVVLFLEYVASFARVEGTSMQPILNPASDSNSTFTSNDYVLLSKISTLGYKFEKGDIVSFRSPRKPNEILIKRVIALEYDKIKISTGNNSNQEIHEIQIPKGCIWVLGDHTKNSLDSRFFGPIPLGLVTAKATHIIWPPNRWKNLKN